MSNISGELNLSALMDYCEVCGLNRIRKEMCELCYHDASTDFVGKNTLFEGKIQVSTVNLQPGMSSTRQ